jgi:hypothetical protein
MGMMRGNKTSLKKEGRLKLKYPAFLPSKEAVKFWGYWVEKIVLEDAYQHSYFSQ